jgi:hypothetical protein
MNTLPVWGERKMRILGIVVPCAALGGCATAPPPMQWLRTDGKRAAGDPVLAQQFDIDRTVCLGERQKAALSGVTIASGTFAAPLAAQDRGNSADAVAKGCMAEKGYVLVRAVRLPNTQSPTILTAPQSFAKT